MKIRDRAGVYVYAIDDKTQLEDNFNIQEFRDKNDPALNNHYILLSSMIPEILQHIRDFYVEKSIYITSGFRTYFSNGQLPTTPTSYHTVGMAVDFTAAVDMKELYEQLLEDQRKKEVFYNVRGWEGVPNPLICVGGLGFYPKRNFIHLDVRNTDKLVTWINDE